jgi:hypothetical protein
VPVFLWISNQSDRSGGGLDGGRHVPCQDSAAERQQRFVLAHPGAFPARQHISRLAHREMITLTVTATLARDGRLLEKD